MTSTHSIKQELLKEIEKLPDHQLQQVLEFVNFFLYFQSQHLSKSENLSELQEQVQKSSDDQEPLSEFIGAVSHGSLAQNSDEALYGS